MATGESLYFIKWQWRGKKNHKTDGVGHAKRLPSFTATHLARGLFKLTDTRDVRSEESQFISWKNRAGAGPSSQLCSAPVPPSAALPGRYNAESGFV